jgi:hypothetical protein
LSGIGPAQELRKFSIPVVVDLPGVGTNLRRFWGRNPFHNFDCFMLFP